jgi:LysM repeat protein
MNNKEYTCIIYNIQSGDTLYSISRRYFVPLTLLLRANPYADVYNLQIGDELCIPVIQPIVFNSFEPYIVEEDDTIQSILEEFGIQLEDLLQANNTTDLVLTPGMTIMIPVYEEDKK